MEWFLVLAFLGFAAFVIGTVRLGRDANRAPPRPAAAVLERRASSRCALCDSPARTVTSDQAVLDIERRIAQDMIAVRDLLRQPHDPRNPESLYLA